ncbi:hypothetical protein BDZ91DRAFT_798640 [Kalaharituber pfeilii]|nr:hypothetical protein BDZ91DRAFT_798640 [Kalaharituber pfeilii]
MGGNAKLLWVKAHIGIAGNEKADGWTKKGTMEKGREVATGSGVRQRIKAWRKEKREIEGFGGGKVMEWSRVATSNFTALPLERGRCAIWLKKLGVAESDRCRCGEVQTGEHLAFRCRSQKNRPEGFERWSDMGKNWKRKAENGEEYDILENFFVLEVRRAGATARWGHVGRCVASPRRRTEQDEEGRRRTKKDEEG